MLLTETTGVAIGTCAIGLLFGSPLLASGECELSGKARLPRTAQLQLRSGKDFAHFTGSKTNIRARFGEAKNGRVPVHVGEGGFSLHGMMKTSALPLFTNSDIHVVPGHLWISRGQSVTWLRTASPRLEVQKVVRYPWSQTITAWGRCTDFSFDTNGVTPVTGLAQEGTPYLVATGATTLLQSPSSSGKPVTTLSRNGTDGFPVVGGEWSNGFVRISYSGEVGFDAWARQTDLKKLPKGEIHEVTAGRSRNVSRTKLQFSGEPSVVAPRQRVRLRLSAKTTAPEIGAISPGTQVYVLDVVSGWASVLPKDLSVASVGEFAFWAKVSDLNRR